jgi:predicted PurR-regulated permease PerM
MSRQSVEISTISFVKFILIFVFAALLYLLRDVLAILALGIILAAAITPFGNWLDKKKFPRLLGIFLLYLTVLGLVIFLVSLVIPVISEDIGQLAQNIPVLLERISGTLEVAEDSGSRFYDVIAEVQNILDTLAVSLQQSSQLGFSLVVGLFGGIISFLSIILISFYLSVMKGGIDSFLKAITPKKYEAYVVDLWERTENKLGKWLQGQLLLALIIGLAVYIGLSLLDVKFALIFALIAMVLELVPNVGPVIAAIPAVAIAFLQSPALGLWVILLYVAIQQAENHILVPLVLGKTVGLNPVVVVIALLAGAKLGGVVGLVLAVPVAAIIVEIIDDIARKKVGELNV